LYGQNYRYSKLLYRYLSAQCYSAISAVIFVFYWPQAEPLVALTEPLGSTGTQLKTNERVQ